MFNPSLGACDTVPNPDVRNLPSCNPDEATYELKLQWYAAALQNPRLN